MVIPSAGGRRARFLYQNTYQQAFRKLAASGRVFVALKLKSFNANERLHLVSTSIDRSPLDIYFRDETRWCMHYFAERLRHVGMNGKMTGLTSSTHVSCRTYGTRTASPAVGVFSLTQTVILSRPFRCRSAKRALLACNRSLVDYEMAHVLYVQEGREVFPERYAINSEMSCNS